VQNWLSKRYPATGNQNTRHDAISAVKRVFNWAVNDMGYFERNPLAKLKKPPRVPRNTFVTGDQWEQVFGKIRDADPFKDFLRFMLETGCRPQEARIIERRNVDWTLKRVHLEKVPGKKGPRDILLTDAALALLQKHDLPNGPIFRNRNGVAWKPDAINCRFQRLQKLLGFKVHAYLARHSKAVELLEAGASAGAVAAILGHQDATMVLVTGW
jgi:integrase